MNDKLTIFVCGTYRDLVEEREAVLESIRRLQYQHDSMEYFGARPNMPIETCLNEVRRSDVLVVVVGHTYGSLVPDLNISYSEAEYREGYRLGKPCLVYMRDENVPVLPKFMEEDPEKIRLLKEFRKILNEHHTAGKFKAPNDLALSVATDLSRIARNLEDTNDPVTMLRRGADAWNIWRSKRPAIYLDLKNVDVRGGNLRGANLSGVNLSQSNLSQCDLRDANLSGAILSFANLSEAKLAGANLRDTDFSNAYLSNVDLSGASLIGTIVDNSLISHSIIYGTNTWDLKGKFKEEKDLVITPPGVPAVTVNRISTAPLIYLFLNSDGIRDVIDTLTSTTVLILGRFATPERKAILDALRGKLLEYGLLPLAFNFDRPSNRDFNETIRILAGLSYFVIADITGPKSSPLELQATVPDYQIPFVPIIQEGGFPFAMFVDLQKKYPWVLNTVSYDSRETLINALKPAIIDPAIKKHNEIRLRKA